MFAFITLVVTYTILGLWSRLIDATQRIEYLESELEYLRSKS